MPTAEPAGFGFDLYIQVIAMPKWHKYTVSCSYSKEWESDPTLKMWITHCAILVMIWSSETNFENPKRFLYS